jgi:hypothetical protein
MKAQIFVFSAIQQKKHLQTDTTYIRHPQNTAKKINTKQAPTTNTSATITTQINDYKKDKTNTTLHFP